MFPGESLLCCHPYHVISHYEQSGLTQNSHLFPEPLLGWGYSLHWDITHALHSEVYHSTPQLEAEESQPRKSADSLFFLCLPELLANIGHFVEPHRLPIGRAYWNTSAKCGCVSPSNHTQKRKAFPLLDGMSEVFTFLHSCNSQGMAKQEWKLRKQQKILQMDSGRKKQNSDDQHCKTKHYK